MENLQRNIDKALKNAVLIKRESNLLKHKYIKCALTSESSQVNLRRGSYNIYFLTYTTVQK